MARHPRHRLERVLIDANVLINTIVQWSRTRISAGIASTRSHFLIRVSP
jgi:hypothetical protein